MNAKQLSCTNCGAPLERFGGHNIESVSCGYCGSVLDVHNDYQVLAKYEQSMQLSPPFTLGMHGNLQGVDFVITGAVNMQDMEGYPWCEYQLYSPTHGYAWLSCEDGHFVFSRRVRYLVKHGGQLRIKSSVTMNGTTFKVFSHGTAVVRQAVGELTYIARTGDKTEYTTCIAPPRMLSIEKGAQEVEYQLGEYLTPEAVYAAFGIDEPPMKRFAIHAAQPYTASSILLAMSQAAKPFAIIAFCAAALVNCGFSGKTVGQFSLASSNPEVASQSVTITDASHPVKIGLKAAVSNSWAAFDFELAREDQPLFSLEKEVSYYYGREGGESWSEGSKTAEALIRLPEPGIYQVSASYAGGDRQPHLDVLIQEGVIVSRYLWILTLLFVGLFLAEPLIRASFEHKRWAEEHGEDD